jgi:alpha-L-arabinofuranosidase
MNYFCPSGPVLIDNKYPLMKRLLLLVLLGWGGGWAGADPARFTIDADHPGISISPTLYGIFFEDINRAGDGGLYAEMLQNRSFEDFNLPLGWTAFNEGESQSTIALDKSHPLNDKNPTSLRLDISSINVGGRAGIYNQGYKGIDLNAKDPVVLPMPGDSNPNPDLQKWLQQFDDAQKRPDNGLNVRQGESYHGSLEARAGNSFSGPLTVSLEKQDGTMLASQELPVPGAEWKKDDFTLTPSAAESNARFVVSAGSSGTVWLDMISLFPDDTFNHRPNGLRADLMQMLVALHPAFVRFPGGSFGEGHRLDEAFRWKETIGEPAQRPGVWNIWGYHASNGLGYFEYLQMCEDLKAEPLFVLNCGISETDMVDVKDLGPWIQDAVDAVDYANGPVTDTWGALRAQAGHPAPFNLKYLEVGNENGMGYFWGGGNARQYADRYIPFYDKLKATYPDLHLIASAPIQNPPVSAPVDIVDEHYYQSADWFEDHANMYDSASRTGPKVYVGEYAVQSGAGDGNMNAALGEAAFMTGLERNSDLVLMASYAPLFVNPSWRDWNPNLIVFDSSRAYGTPSYYNQLLFANNRPDVLLPLDLQMPPGGDPKARPALYAVAGEKKDSGEIIVKVVNITGQPQDASIGLKGGPVGFTARATVLASENPSDENSFAQPDKVEPRESDLGSVNSPFQYSFKPYSITILSLKK